MFNYNRTRITDTFHEDVCTFVRVLRKLRFPDFVTTAQDGGKVVSLTQRPSLPPENTPGTHFC